MKKTILIILMLLVGLTGLYAQKSVYVYGDVPVYNQSTPLKYKLDLSLRKKVQRIHELMKSDQVLFQGRSSNGSCMAGKLSIDGYVVRISEDRLSEYRNHGFKTVEQVKVEFSWFKQGIGNLAGDDYLAGEDDYDHAIDLGKEDLESGFKVVSEFLKDSKQATKIRLKKLYPEIYEVKYANEYPGYGSVETRVSFSCSLKFPEKYSIISIK